jgi:antitoxin Phd
MSWTIYDAKARLSELIETAQTGGPQTITRHGNERAVVLSIADYRALVDREPTLVDYLLAGPRVDGLGLQPRPPLGSKAQS